MKIYNLLITGFIILILASCSTQDDVSQDVFSVVPTTINNVQMNIGDYKQYLIQEQDSALFEVDVNEETFQANEIKIIKQDSILSIIGKNASLDRTVFLNFTLEEEGTILLGQSKDNPKNNVAGYLLNSENKGYVTSEIYSTCGSITIENIDSINNTISGQFNFSACDRGNHVLELTNGVFKNISFN